MFVTFHLLRFANYVSNIFIFGKVIQFASHPCHCNSFLESNFWKRKIVILIFGIATFCLKHCLNSPRHAFNQILTNRWFYLLPLLLKLIPQLMNTTGRLFILPKLLFDMIPQMFYWVEVWGLRGPVHDCESMVIEPSFGLFAGVLWVIVLHQTFWFLAPTCQKEAHPPFSMPISSHLSPGVRACANGWTLADLC